MFDSYDGSYGGFDLRANAGDPLDGPESDEPVEECARCGDGLAATDPTGLCRPCERIVSHPRPVDLFDCD